MRPRDLARRDFLADVFGFRVSDRIGRDTAILMRCKKRPSRDRRYQNSPNRPRTITPGKPGVSLTFVDSAIVSRARVLA